MSSARRPRRPRRNCARTPSGASPTPNGSPSKAVGAPRPTSVAQQIGQLRAQLDELTTRATAAEQLVASERAAAQEQAAAAQAAASAEIERMRRESENVAQQLGRLRAQVDELTARAADAERGAAAERHGAQQHLAAAQAASAEVERVRREAEDARRRSDEEHARAVDDLQRRLAEAAAVPAPAAIEIAQPSAPAEAAQPPAVAASVGIDGRPGGRAFGRRRDVAEPIEPRHAAQPGEPSFADLREQPEPAAVAAETGRDLSAILAASVPDVVRDAPRARPRPPGRPTGATRPPTRDEQPARWDFGRAGGTFFDRGADEDDGPAGRDARLVPELSRTLAPPADRADPVVAGRRHWPRSPRCRCARTSSCRTTSRPRRWSRRCTAARAATTTGCSSNKLAYHLHDVHRGDVVVFDRPSSWHGISEKTLIKRVIGLPGETLTEQRRHRVRRTASGCTEPYVNKACKQGTTFPQRSYTVPEGDVFVMGDNRCFSDDSRMQAAGARGRHRRARLRHHLAAETYPLHMTNRGCRTRSYRRAP